LRCPISNNVTCKVRNGKNPSTRVNTLAETAKRYFPPLAYDFPSSGVISGLLIVAQAWLLARILNHMIMENIPREALLLPFIVLILIFVLRAWVVWLRERVGFHAGQHIRYEIRRQVLDGFRKPGPRGSRVNRPEAGRR
jgi:ABC-type multidrug transport system fused ATPase/permease subunit